MLLGHKGMYRLGLGGGIGVTVALAFLLVACAPESAPPPDTPRPPSSPTPVQEQPEVAPEPDGCVECHSDQRRLIDSADEEAAHKPESSGEG